MRRVELILGVGTALAAIGAIVATIFVPLATTGHSVDGGAPVIHYLYARDHGLVPMLAVIVFIAALAACVLLGAYYQYPTRIDVRPCHHVGRRACLRRAHTRKPVAGFVRCVPRCAGAGMRAVRVDSHPAAYSSRGATPPRLTVGF